MIRFLLPLLLLFQAPAGLKVNTGVVTGILRTDAGLPLAGVRIAVSPANETAGLSVLESLGQTDNAGRYRLENVSPGRYNILVGRSGQSTYHPGVAEPGRATTIQVVSGLIVEVPDMVVAGGASRTVTGQVVDLATGKGRRIENVVLCCDASRPFLLANPAGTVRSFVVAVSDDGSFTFPLVPPGNYFLSASDPKLIPVSWALVVGENHVTGIELDVTEGVEVQGTVLDQTNAPVTASVRLRPKPPKPVSDTIGSPVNTTGFGKLLIPSANPSPGARGERLQKTAKEDSNSIGPEGRFAFHKVYPGTYILEINAKGVTLLEQEVQIGTAEQTTLSLQVPLFQVAGRVVAPTGDPLPKLNYIRLLRGTDAEVFYGFPDAEGRFSLLLTPGEYRVFAENLGPSVQSISDGSRDITNTEFTFEGGRNQQIVVTLKQ